MGKAVVGTCDYKGCGVVGEQVQTAQVIVDGHEWVADLCQTHLAPIIETLRNTSKRKQTSRERVWTLDEIEALKQKQQRGDQ